jgi:hypothetical protein
MSPRKTSTGNSVCLNHPDSPATTRCTTCFKPICADCVVRAEGEDFCSEVCKANYEGSRDSLERFQEITRRRRAARRRRQLVMLIVLGGVAYFGYRYFSSNPGILQQWKQRVQQFMR